MHTFHPLTMVHHICSGEHLQVGPRGFYLGIGILQGHGRTRRMRREMVLFSRPFQSTTLKDCCPIPIASTNLSSNCCGITKVVSETGLGGGLVYLAITWVPPCPSLKFRPMFRVRTVVVPVPWGTLYADARSLLSTLRRHWTPQSLTRSHPDPPEGSLGCPPIYSRGV